MKFVITHALSDAGMKALEESGAEVFVANSADPYTYLDELKTADAFIIRIGECREALIRELPNLKVLGRTGVGYDSIDVKVAAAEGIPTVVTHGANSLSVAEHALGMMFALSKNLVESDSEMRQGNWKVRDSGKNFELFGKKVGIVGVGGIGSILAKLCQALGMKTAGYSSSHNRAKVENAGCEYYENLDEMLRECDIISLHMPLTEQTRNMISARELGLMKKSALLINTARGPLVNTRDLADALNNDRIAGAAVDVFATEPADLSDPVFTAKNLLCTPHSAALAREAKDRMAVQCVAGCLAVLRGEKWDDVVDKSAYDHSRVR